MMAAHPSLDSSAGSPPDRPRSRSTAFWGQRASGLGDELMWASPQLPKQMLRNPVSSPFSTRVVDITITGLDPQ